MDTAACEDTALVEAMRRGERAGLEGMYRRYADRLYTYARTMVRDPEAAADAVHDAFLTAGQRIDQLRKSDRLRSWLYAIVRNECLRQLRERSRSLPLDEADEPVVDADDPATGVNAEQVRALVHTAVAALNPGDREVVHLAIRHNLSTADIGAALGVPANHAHARLSRARSQLERALGALLVARTGARDCPTLAGLIDGWQGRLTPTLRKRVSRHIESCAVCGLLRREHLNPAALLSAYTAPAFLVVTDTVWPRLAEVYGTAVPTDPAGAVTARPTADPALVVDEPSGSQDGGPATERASVADEPSGPAGRKGEGPTTAGGGAVASDGAAVPHGAAHAVRPTSSAKRDRRRRRLAGATALLALLTAFGTWALLSERGTTVRDGAGKPASRTLESPTGKVASASAPPSAAEAETPAADPPPTAAADPGAGNRIVPSDDAEATRTDAPEAALGGVAPAPTVAPTRPPTAPRPTAATRIAAPLTVSVTAHVRCGSDTYSLVVQATGSAALRGAEVSWTPDGGRTSVRALTVDGSVAQGTVGQLRASALTWSVRATAVDGRTAQSPSYPVARPCVRPG
ncbi:sigma-70 family RNA polymerase sigma factor [Micromonospora sp. NPDC047134]|uniref:RNA polymerase sigma factor n=1 Tax=Micromonospora sp. NPDC047134 TaxID=3154340 RepID=UPI0033ED925D